ncbi:phytoene desaturase family protein [Mycolicibacterium aichiense]|uniref:Pyridine nucleotide-disulfide oxidoreductase domain-containing protein 2 n=1 Tax=Mycolicibacterium aichiense TaxID=1799 RepID=A0AAD1HL76_9MYCO|nr:NAD(P)/FAD-dependent oxidoreductase [Mycolicibacterium aichiense]MCV7018643.1 NAD(P)/FAD-dependent oxidoreductase [Mycolicibacterium aichiense]BBX07402.1 FAD-dependent oxidoreductase [Mycolicibacterium aichiense]STZ81217.1 FAD dependent oxidoreductase [Mycolicibacterium aichiense]
MPTSPDYDAIVIGAGHNGLVTANYLARAGKRVLVLEAREVVGGACVTEELIPGSKWSSCAFIAGLLRPEIIAELELARFGLELYQGDALSFSLFRDGTSITMWKETDRTLREIEKLNKGDAQAFLDFGVRLQKFAGLVTPWLLKSPPERSEVLAAFEAAGEQKLFDEFTLISVRDLLDRYFEDERLKSMLTFFGMVSIYGGPSSPGTAYTYGHHSWGEFDGNFGQFGMARGGMGAISEALAAGARHYGATIRTSAPVERVLVERGVATGVRLRDGSVITGSQIFSNADPKRSLLRLLEPGVLSQKLVHEVENIDTRGSMARIHLLIDELPQYLPFPDASEGPQHHGHQLLGASREAFEEAFEAQRRGTFPSTFVIEAVIQSVTDDSLAPKGRHTMTLGIQQLPSELTGTTWAVEKERWADLVLEDLFSYAPNLRGHILDRVIITPDDLDNEYLITDGNIFHGSMMLDQLFGARPLPELADYRTPIRNYYLCGVGTHPGGGVMGASGHNAAKVALDDADGVTTPSRLRTNGHKTPWQQRLVGGLMSTKSGRWLSYQAARQPAMRKITAYAARVR